MAGAGVFDFDIDDGMRKPEEPASEDEEDIEIQVWFKRICFDIKRATCFVIKLIKPLKQHCYPLRLAFCRNKTYHNIQYYVKGFLLWSSSCQCIGETKVLLSRMGLNFLLEKGGFILWKKELDGHKIDWAWSIKT